MDPKTFKPETTIEQARQLLTEKKYEGVICPCCSQNVKVYKRKFNAGMAKALLLIYKISDPLDFGFIHVQNEFVKYGIKNPISLEYSKLEHWRLIETRKGENPSGANRSGEWKLTPYGISFAKGGNTVREIVEVFDARVYGFSGGKLHITDAIKNKFSYYDLMGFEPLNELPGGTP